MCLHKCNLKILKKMCQEKWENAYLALKNARASHTNVCAQVSCKTPLRTVGNFQEKFLPPPTKSLICYFFIPQRNTTQHHDHVT